MESRRKFLQTAGVVGVLGVTGVGTASARRPGDTILEIAGGADTFETLAAAVAEAGIGSVLDGNRQLTVFAPTDEAFAALGANPSNVGAIDFEAAFGLSLVEILTYHVAPGRRSSVSVLDSDEIPTLNGAKIVLDGLRLNPDGSEEQAEVVADEQGVTFDVAASNGIVHAIDGVLLPPA